MTISARPRGERSALTPYVVLDLRDQLDATWRQYDSVVDARSRFVIGEDPPEAGMLRRGVLDRWKSTTPLRRPEPSPEVLEVIRRGERKLYEEYLAARAKRRAS